MTAYDQYARKLSREEKDRYLREQAPIGRLGGADHVPETVGDLEDYVERMRPRLAMNDQTVDFMAFLAGRAPEQTSGRWERLDRWIGIRASMALMPGWARQMTGTHPPDLLRRLVLAPSNRLKAALVRWACPQLPCKRMALARALRG
jgi:uncharacterized protein (DUF2236 family)